MVALAHPHLATDGVAGHAGAVLSYVACAAALLPFVYGRGTPREAAQLVAQPAKGMGRGA